MKRTVKAIAAVSAGIVSIAAALAVLGVNDFPRPAWSSELRELIGQHIELDSRVTSQQLDDTRLRWFQNDREQRQYPDDPNLLQEQIILDRKIDDLTNRLEELRDAD